MENILLPNKMTFTPAEGENETVLTIEPLYYGYGTTIGNTLRRVLLSSLEGAAVTAVKIDGVQHEFSTVEGVKEDALEIIMNLKKLRLKVHSDEPVKLELEVSKKTGSVTAAEIQANADVEIANPDLHLAELTDKSTTLKMTIVVEKGRGYRPTEEMDTTKDEIGLIAVDAVFSPVIRVGMKVENTRVGDITNYDKLVMNIETDGTLTAEEAVSAATSVAQDHFNWIQGQTGATVAAEKTEEGEE